MSRAVGVSNTALAVAAMALLLVAGTGCPFLGGLIGTAKVTVLVASDSGAAKSASLDTLALEKAAVSTYDIESLVVTVNEISLDQVGGDNSADQSSTKSGAMDKSKVVVFSGSQDVDLIDPQGLSDILSTADVPAGTYTKIRLAISNPRLTLKADPNTVITNIQLTANGHLFVSKLFILPPDGNNLIVLTFKGIHLVQTGNGRYVLTPQLRADINVQSADVTATGTIAELDTTVHTFTLTLADGSVHVDYSSAAIFLATDTGTATGSESDLANGLSVEVIGTVDVEGNVTATEVHLLP